MTDAKTDAKTDANIQLPAIKLEAVPSEEIALPQPDFEIREMGIDDLSPVYHLGERLFTSEQYPSLYRTWEEWEVIGLYNTDPEYCLVAEADKQVAGFVLGTMIDKPTWTYGYIIWLGVSPDFQRRGIADKLVDKIVERMIEEGASSLMMDTDPSNEAAIKFFTRKGFGNPRQHVFLSLDLDRHEYYGRLVEYERGRSERHQYRRPKRQR
ncbi:MAG: GNAT family N-acetyltransferase [Pegethrix bostrychoides GSE-TBD4-15B]|jgi:ribosomal protein S18 acetylase RimI-like enzyme|uniref:GNAT family N-acetyltransferase n=1 Tax=Pegethrix bostrychoides GSE-TBD4-15B TaxID=2839662 RepID=A0A951PB56_9CYAN|nr:GNAT family N-acetyltransferase [Pegethrix bostrychoides GSE-TBD4-15B]